MLPLQPNTVDLQTMAFNYHPMKEFEENGKDVSMSVENSTDRVDNRENSIDRVFQEENSSDSIEIIFDNMDENITKIIKSEPKDDNDSLQDVSCKTNASQTPVEQYNNVQSFSELSLNEQSMNGQSVTEQSRENCTRPFFPAMKRPYSDSTRSHSAPMTEDIYNSVRAPHGTIDSATRSHSADPCSVTTNDPHSRNSKEETLRFSSLINRNMEESPIIKPELPPCNVSDEQVPAPIQNKNAFYDTCAASANPPSDNPNRICQQNDGNYDPFGRPIWGGHKRLKVVGNVTSVKRTIPHATIQSTHTVPSEVVHAIDGRPIQKQNARMGPKRNGSMGSTNGRSSSKQVNKRNTPPKSTPASTNCFNSTANEQLLPQNANSNVVKKKRGRPPGQKNKKPSAKVVRSLPPPPLPPSPPHAFPGNVNILSYLYQENGHSNREKFQSYFERHAQIYPTDISNVQQTQYLDATKRKKRVAKPRCKNVKDTKEKPKNSVSAIAVWRHAMSPWESAKDLLDSQQTSKVMNYQKGNGDCQIFENYTSATSLAVNNSVSQVFNLARGKQKHVDREHVCDKNTSNDCLAMLEDNSNETYSNINKVSKTSTSHNNAYDVRNESVGSVDTSPSVTQKNAVDYTINGPKTSNSCSSQNSLQSNRPGTEDSYTLSSSDDEGPAIVYKVRDHAAKNVMYSSNVLEECLNGNNCGLVSPIDKSLQALCENYNTENASSSLNSNSLSCTYSGAESPVSSNFQNNIDQSMCEADGTQFSEENVGSTTVPQNCIYFSNGKVWPSSNSWKNFGYLIYTPGNEKYYAFDPKRPIIVNFPEEKRSNYLPPSCKNINGAYPNIISDNDLNFYSTAPCQSNAFLITEGNTQSIENKEFKFFRLEIRGNDRLGFQEIVETSNSKYFKCQNFTISYEQISVDEADKILNFCKPPRIDTLDHYQKSQKNVNIFESAELFDDHTTCFWKATLMTDDDPAGSAPVNQNNQSPSQEISSSFQTTHCASDKVIQVPCRRLVGISDLPFKSVINFVMEDKELSNLIEEEISKYMSENPASSGLPQMQSTERNNHQSNVSLQEINNSTTDRPVIKKEPPDTNPLFPSPALQETRCTESVVPMDFSYDNLNTQNANALDDDCVLLEDNITNVTPNSNCIPYNNTNSTHFSTEVNQNNWAGNISRQSNNTEINYRMMLQHNTYVARREAPVYNPLRSDCDNQCRPFEDDGRVLLEPANSAGIDITKNMLFESGNFEREVNNQRRDYFGDGRSFIPQKNCTLHENVITDPNHHFSHQKASNQSTNNGFEYHSLPENIYQPPLLPTTNNHVNTSQYQSNSCTEFAKTNNIPDSMSNVLNANIQRVNNQRETGSLVTGSQNVVHPTLPPCNSGELAVLNVGYQTQTGSDVISFDLPLNIRYLHNLVTNFEAQNSPSKRVSKSTVTYNEMPAARSRAKNRQEITPAYRFNSGGNIIDQNVPCDKRYSLSIKDPNSHSYTTQHERRFFQEPNYNAMTPPMNLSAAPYLPPTLPVHSKSSNHFLGESLDPKNRDRVNNSQCLNQSAVSQKSVDENYPMCATEEMPMNLHVTQNTSLLNFDKNARSPKAYHPGYNEYQAGPQSVMSEPSQEMELLRNGQVFQQCHFLELTRPCYQNGPGEQMDSDTFMGNSHSSVKILEPNEFAAQVYPENTISGINSCYINDFQCEELPPKSIPHDKPDGPAKKYNNTIAAQIEQAVLSKNENQLTGLLSEVERYVDGTHYHRIKAHLGLLQGRFEDTLSIIQENQFPVEIHREMQTLWSQAQKLIENRNLPKNLRFKQRASDKSFPPTIFVDYNEVLSDWYKRDMYPKADTRVFLATKTGLSEKKVNTWFKNRRQRDRRTSGSVRGGRRGGRRPRHPKASPSSAEPVAPRPSAPSMPIFPTTFPTDQ